MVLSKNCSGLPKKYFVRPPCRVLINNHFLGGCSLKLFPVPKGLRHMEPPELLVILRLKLFPVPKGLRLTRIGHLVTPLRLKLFPVPKGLRQIPTPL